MGARVNLILKQKSADEQEKTNCAYQRPSPSDKNFADEGKKKKNGARFFFYDNDGVAIQISRSSHFQQRARLKNQQGGFTLELFPSLRRANEHTLCCPKNRTLTSQQEVKDLETVEQPCHVKQSEE